MSNLAERARAFLSQEPIAVVGVSRSGKGTAHLIWNKLRTTGHETYAINSGGGELGGVRLYRDIDSLPVRPAGVVVVTPAAAALEVAQQSKAAGVSSVWFHCSFDAKSGSSSPEAVDCCRNCGIAVIDGACPMMYCDPVDFGHKCIRFFLRLMGKLPK